MEQNINKCKECQKTKTITCFSCPHLIDGGTMINILESPRTINIQTPEGDNFTGQLVMVSPVGIGIHGQIKPSEKFIIELQKNVKIFMKKIANRGKDDFHGFDIIEVQRMHESSHRLNTDEFNALTMSNSKLIAEVTQNLPENVKEIIQERLKIELEKAKIMDSLRFGQAFKYQKGFIKAISNETKKLPLPTQELAKLADKCIKTGRPDREVFIAKEKIYDIHSIPFDYQSAGLLVLDATPLIERERKMKYKEKRIYRDVIEAVTCGKLLLLEKEEISTYTACGETIYEKDFKEPHEMEQLRTEIEGSLVKIGMEPKEILMFLFCISEALTNAIKHANGGTCKLNVVSDTVRVIISDNGPGISYKQLPKATLMKGFSTKKSLGCGFSIILKFVDRLLLCSSSKGTIVTLEKTINRCPFASHMQQ